LQIALFLPSNTGIDSYPWEGIVDEREIALAPVLFSGGRRIFESLRDPGPLKGS
jgi:hypothetical protein